jgi:hypothetical protein
MLIRDLVDIVSEYVIEKPLKLRNWITNIKINWTHLSSNPAAIHMLESNKDKIYWEFLFENPSIFEVDTELYKTKMREITNILIN